MTMWMLIAMAGGTGALALWLALYRLTRKPMPGAKGTHHEVLVIDDNPYVLDVIRTGLEAEGYKVHLAATGKSGVAFFREHCGKLSVVLLDYYMPEMSGAVVFEELQKIKADVPVILITGFCDDAQKFEHMTQSVAGFLVKPFRLEQLLGVMREARARRRQG
jgi:DNA-binding NtrC family response regulator